jgi:hypothetical protein
MNLLDLKDASAVDLKLWERNLQLFLIHPTRLPKCNHLNLMDILLEVAGCLHVVRLEIKRRKP